MATAVVLGGGISGLSCAYYLSTIARQYMKKIILIESGTALGGWIRTTRYPDGTIFEHGPRSMRPVGKAGYNALTLVNELGLSSAVLPVIKSHPAAQKRLILVRNQLHTLPSGPSHLFQKVPPFSKPFIWYLLRDLITRKKKVEDESIHDFAIRRFGKEIAEYILDPVCRGIVAGDSREISVRSLFGNFFRGEQEHGSVVKGQLKQMKESKLEDLLHSDLVIKSKSEGWAMWTLRNGLQSLPEAIVKHLENDDLVQILTNAPCKRINFEGGKAAVMFGESHLLVNHVFSSIPSRTLSRLLSASYPALAQNLSSIQAVHVAVVNLEFKGKVLQNEGFGFLVPSSQKSNVLGIIFDSCCFPEHDGKYSHKTRITCMMGGRWFRDILGDVDTASLDNALELAVEAAYNHLGITNPPVRNNTSIQKGCIPQYKVGHHQILQGLHNEIQQNALNLSLFGSSYEGVSVNDCIYNSKLAVEKFVQTIRQS